jgi:hypothetical protein
MGASKEPEYAKSPDVSIDGSVATEDAPKEHASKKEPGSSGPGRARSVYNWVRGTIRAPFMLLREYIIPIVAFLLVFGAAFYLIFVMS